MMVWGRVHEPGAKSDLGGASAAGDRAIAQRHRERDKLAFPVSTHIAIADA